MLLDEGIGMMMLQNFLQKYKNKIDLLVGGSPCQAFSMVGKRKDLMMQGEHFFMIMRE